MTAIPKGYLSARARVDQRVDDLVAALGEMQWRGRKFSREVALDVEALAKEVESTVNAGLRAIDEKAREEDQAS